jgi:hypothetical protein
MCWAGLEAQSPVNQARSSLAKAQPSDVHGLASGQKPSQAKPHRPGQAKPKVLAWSWLWPGLDFQKAKANGPGYGFELNILRKLFPSVLL